MSRLRPAVIVAVLVGAATSASPAEPPRVQLRVLGTCPTAGRLEAQIRKVASITADAAGAWAVRVERKAETTRFSLRRPEGTVVLERGIRSTDCEALAQAIALVLESHFVGLDLVPSARPPPGHVPPRRARPAAARDADTPPLVVDAPRGRQRWVFALALSGGLQLGMDPALVAVGGQFEILAAPARAWVWPRLTASIGERTTQFAGAERILHRQAVFRLDIVRRFGRALWVQPGVGAGLGLSHVTAASLNASPTVLRAQFAVGPTLAAGWRLAPRWSLKSEVSLSVFPKVDEYIIVPFGVVGYSPRASLTLGLGLELNANL